MRPLSADEVAEEEEVPLTAGPPCVAAALAIQAAMGDLAEVVRTCWPGIAEVVKKVRDRRKGRKVTIDFKVPPVFQERNACGQGVLAIAVFGLERDESATQPAPSHKLGSFCPTDFSRNTNYKL